MVICLEWGADLHTAKLTPLPLTVSCFSKIQIGFTFLVPALPGSLGPLKRAVKRVCVCVCVFMVHSIQFRNLICYSCHRLPERACLCRSVPQKESVLCIISALGNSFTAFSALTLLVGRQEGHLAYKKTWVVMCWCGYLSGARCILAYRPADATATHCLLLQ